MKITEYQLQQQINFAEAIVKEIRDAKMDEESECVQEALEYCGDVINACHLAQIALKNNTTAEKKKEPVAAEPKAKTKPKRNAKKKEETPQLESQTETSDAAELDDLF